MSHRPTTQHLRETRSFRFHPNRHGSAESLAALRADNLSFKRYSAQYEGDFPFLDAFVGHNGLKRLTLSDEGAHRDIDPDLQYLIRGKWREGRKTYRIFDHNNKPYVPGYYELNAINDGSSWARSVALRVPEEILDATMDSPKEPRMRHNSARYCFLQLITEQRGNHEPTIVGSFFGQFFGGFSFHKATNEHGGEEQVKRTRDIKIYKLDRVLTQNILLAADTVYREAALDPLTEFRLQICRSMEALESLLAGFNLPPELVERLSLKQYGDKRHTSLYSSLLEERKRLRKYFLQAENVRGNERLLGLQLEDALFPSREENGLADQFQAIDTLEAVLTGVTGLSESQLTAFSTAAVTSMRKALVNLTKYAFNLNPFARLDEQYYGPPLLTEEQWRDMRDEERDHKHSVHEERSNTPTDVPSEEASHSQDETSSSEEQTDTTPLGNDGDGEGKTDPTEQPSDSTDKQPRRTPRTKEESKKKAPSSKRRQQEPKKGLGSLKDLDVENKSN